MRTRPGRAVTVKEERLQLGDREGIEVAVTGAIAAALDRVADPIVHEPCAADVGDARGQESQACLLAQAVVAGAAQGQVAFLEGVGEDECAAQLLAVQARAIARSRARRVNTGIIARRYSARAWMSALRSPSSPATRAAASIAFFDNG